jgi:hypothetical protein
MRKYNYICIKDKFNSKGYFAPVCPKCGIDMVCIGERWRIGKNGKFDKIEGRAKKAKLGINTYITK